MGLPSTLQAWYSATRPRTLTATYVPLGMGLALAWSDGRVNVWHFLWATIGAVALQIAANLINEFADYQRGADALKVAGQGMTIKNAVLTPRSVLVGAVSSLLLGVGIGLWLVTQTGLPLLWIGLGGVLTVVMYTAGPFPLAYNALGEVAVGIFMGPVFVLGTYYAVTEQLSWQAVWVALPISFTVSAILHANNIRDMEADRAVNKRTLALLLGRNGAILEYMFLIDGAYLTLVVLVGVGWIPFTSLIALITLPEAYRLIQVFRTETDPLKLHPAQGQTARLHGRFGLLIVLGWLLYEVFVLFI